MGQVKACHGCDVWNGDGALACFGNPGEGVPEDVVVGCQSRFYCLAVEGAQSAQVAGDGVALQPLVFKPRLIRVYEVCGKFIEDNVFSCSES